MDSHHDLGELYITENDIHPYNPDTGRTYRYWGCKERAKTDERHTTSQNGIENKPQTENND